MRRRAKAPVVQSVTTAPTAPADDQGVRIRRYLIAMSCRLVFFVLAIVTTGWVRWTFVAAALFLPYVAVVLANAVGPRQAGGLPMVSPGPQDPPSLEADADRTRHVDPP